jgi:nucleoside-triphosphatase THEP1
MTSRPRPAPASIIPEQGSALGVVAYPDRADIEALLAAFVERLRGEGVRVGGLLQRTTREANGRPRMELIDIESGETVLISQNRGALSKGCCVDTGGMAAAAVLLRRALVGGPDLLVINKFSGLEAEGGGLRAEFLAALAEGVPLLTGLSERHRAAFDAMTGGGGDFLEASIEALSDWWENTGGDAGATRQ